MLQHREVSREWRDRGPRQLQRPAAQILSGQVVLACPRRRGTHLPPGRTRHRNWELGWDDAFVLRCWVFLACRRAQRRRCPGKPQRAEPVHLFPHSGGMCNFCHFLHTTLARSGLQLYQARWIRTPTASRAIPTKPVGTIDYSQMCRIARFPIRLIHQPVELSCRGNCIWSRHCNAAFSPHHRVCQ